MAAMAAAVIAAVESPVTETGEGGVAIAAGIAAAVGPDAGVDADATVTEAVEAGADEEDVVASACPFG